MSDKLQAYRSTGAYANTFFPPYSLQPTSHSGSQRGDTSVKIEVTSDNGRVICM